jgi:hypothetical protein
MRCPGVVPCVLLAALTAGCADETVTPTDPSDIVLEELGINAALIFHEHELPFSFSTSFCGETQLWEGADNVVAQLTETPSGRTLFAIEDIYKGTVTGVPSGNIYRLNGHFVIKEIGETEGPQAVYNNTGIAVLIGQGTTPNMVSHYNIKVTMNANGDVVVDRVVSDLKCP